MSKDKKAPLGVASPPEMKPGKELLLPNSTMGLLYALLNVPLHGPQSRARNRFAEIVKKRITWIEDERVKLLEERCNKNEDGTPKKKIGESGQEEYDIDATPLAEYRGLLEKLMHDNFVLDAVMPLKADLISIRPIILDSRLPLETVDGYIYEQICKAFEAI